MRSRRLILALGAVCLLAAAAAAALLLGNRREVTTSSAAAYRAYREGIENEQRFYMKDARVGFAKALELDPDFPMAMLGLARNSDHDQAKSLIERARRLRDRLSERERLHIELQFASVNGRFDEVLKVARAIHEKYPEDVRAAMILAGEAIAKGNSSAATAIFSDLLAIDPNNAGAYNQLGYFYAYRGEYEKALENFKKYQFLAPDQANPYDSMGEVQAFSGRYEEAEANLNRALAIKPDFYASYDHLGVVSEGKGDYARAIAYYEKAADNAIADGQREGFLAKALRITLLTKDRATAQRLIARMQALPKGEFSEFRRSYFDVGRDLLDNRAADAERILKDIKPGLYAAIAKRLQGTGLKPYDPGWNLLMGLALVAQGKEAEAIAIYEEMANPPSPWKDLESRRWVQDGRARLAALLARRGDVDRAEKLLAENRKWNPSWAPARAAEEAVAQARREQVLAASK